MALLTLSMVAVFTAAVRADAPQLSPRQRAQVLQEAQGAFNRGVQVKTDQPLDAEAFFTQAAGKYQLLVGQGIRNSKLYFNLANAYLHSGQRGRATANYQRALRLDPGDRRAAANLAFVRSKLDPAIAPGRGWWQAVVEWNRRLAMGALLWIGLSAWCVLWLGLAGVFYVKYAWLRYAAVSAGAVVVFSVISVGLYWIGPGSEDQGIVTGSSVLIRNGGGDGFALKYELALTRCASFRLIEQRDGWLHIRFDDGRAGWISVDQAELVFANPWCNTPS